MITGQSEQNSYWGGGGEAERRYERSEEEWVSRGLLHGKFFVTTPFRSLENAPLLENQFCH